MPGLVLQPTAGPFPQRVRLETVPPAPLEVGQDVRVQLRWATLSVEDLRRIHAGLAGPETLVLGRGGVGEIQDAGNRVDTSRLGPGTRVVLDPVVACLDLWPPDTRERARDQACPSCRAGVPEACTQERRGSWPGVNRPGTLNESIVVTQGAVHPVPEAVGDEAILVPALALALRALDILDLPPGASLVVFGATTVGRLVILRARERGLRVALIDPERSRLDRATPSLQRAGWAVVPVSGGASPAERLRTEVRGIQRSLEAAGFAGPIDGAIDTLGPLADRGLYLTGPGGRIAVLGRDPPDHPATLRWMDLVTTGRTVVGVPSGKGHVRAALEVLAAGLHGASDLLGDPIPLDRLPRAGWERLGVDPETGERTLKDRDQVVVRVSG